MAIISRKETERRLRAMARTTVDMERGIYQWPDGRKPLKPDGTPWVVKAEIARSAGYHGDSNQRNMEKWFTDPYYIKQLQIERRRRDFNMEEVLAAEENLPLAIAKGLLEILITRIATDPDSITTNQILSFAPQLHKYGLELAAAQGQLQQPRDDAKVANFNAFTGPILIDATAGQREHLLESAKTAAGERLAALQDAITTATIIEEHAYGGSDDAASEDDAVSG